MKNVPGFSAAMSLSSGARFQERGAAERGISNPNVVVPQMPKWFRCAVAIAAETAACLGGPNPVCIIAAAKALDTCVD